MKMKTIWHPWSEWECYEAGMYDGQAVTLDDKAAYSQFLSDIPRFRAAMDRVVSEWPISCEHFLTKRGFNRIAWLGQAAMCIDAGVSRRHRSGYMLLDSSQQQAANDAAERVLNEWLAAQDKHVHANVEASRLPSGHTRCGAGRIDGGLFGPFIQGDLFGHPEQRSPDEVAGVHA